MSEYLDPGRGEVLKEELQRILVTPYRPPAENLRSMEDTETSILAELASLTALINNRSDALEKMVSSNLVVVAEAIRDNSKQMESIKESLECICADLKNIKSKINRCEKNREKNRMNDGQKTKGSMAAEQRTSSLEQMTPSQVHLSVFHKTKPPKVERCTQCCTHFHCPLCPTGMYKPRSRAMVLQHLEVHKKNALQHEDFYITKCHHACRPGNGGHFHCPVCNRTMVRREDAERHMSTCRPVSVLGEERPQEKKIRSDPIAARQEKASVGNSPIPELSLPSKPSLDNPSCKVLRASQKSVFCHHCNVKMLKKNMKKHIFRKHTNVAGRNNNDCSSLDPHQG